MSHENLFSIFPIFGRFRTWFTALNQFYLSLWHPSSKWLFQRLSHGLELWKKKKSTGKTFLNNLALNHLFIVNDNSCRNIFKLGDKKRNSWHDSLCLPLIQSCKIDENQKSLVNHLYTRHYPKKLIQFL